MADWDADDFEPEAPAAVTVAKVTDKWEGEDEDDDVKVNLFYNLSVYCVMIEFHVGWFLKDSGTLHQEKVKVVFFYRTSCFGVAFLSLAIDMYLISLTWLQDDWEASSEEEEKKEEEVKPVKVKKKKTLAQKIAEKEAAAEEARLEAEAEAEEDTPEAR